MSDNRRDFIKKSTLIGLSGLVSTLFGNEKLSHLESLSKLSDSEILFYLPKLPYSYDALEPYIDKQTMEVHHSKHHQTYVDKLNKALENYNEDKSLNLLLKKASDLNTAIRNYAGGHFNHSLFWQLLSPNPNGEKSIPLAKLNEAINNQFKSFDNFKKEFTEIALKTFGSGWCWLILQEGKLKITSTPNQDNPLMNMASENGKPILALDIWEHAYYLKYQNKRADYITNWWNIINWKKAEELFLDK
jgi:Fe-Mn family superoxide dismutase